MQSVIFSDQSYLTAASTRSQPHPAPPSLSTSLPDPSFRWYPPLRGVSAAGLTIPIDTQVKIRMIDSVNSDKARLGETFRASLDEPI